MAFTGVLGTADSRLGNIVLGFVPTVVTGVDGLGWLRRSRRADEAPVAEAAFRVRPWLTTVFPPPFVEDRSWRRRPAVIDEPVEEAATAKRRPWLAGPVWLPRRTPGADEPAVVEPLPRRFVWIVPPSPGLGGEWVVRPRRVFPEPQVWAPLPPPTRGWLPYVRPQPIVAACPYRPVRPDQAEASAGRPDEGGASSGRPDEVQMIAGRPDESCSRPGRPNECR